MNKGSSRGRKMGGTTTPPIVCFVLCDGNGENEKKSPFFVHFAQTPKLKRVFTILCFCDMIVLDKKKNRSGKRFSFFVTWRVT